MDSSSVPLPPSLGTAPQPLFVFDGVCVLCSRSVRFVLAREKNHELTFAPAQSALGQAIYQALGLSAEVYDTLIVLDQGRAYLKSAAVMQLARRLRQPWRSLAVLEFLPRHWLDWLYDRVARNRYRLFGRYDSCPLPDASLRARYVENVATASVQSNAPGTNL